MQQFIQLKHFGNDVRTQSLKKIIRFEREQGQRKQERLHDTREKAACYMKQVEKSEGEKESNQDLCLVQFSSDSPHRSHKVAIESLALFTTNNMKIRHTHTHTQAQRT